MQLPDSNRSVSTNGVTASTDFSLSMNDATHIMDMLRNGIYSDKVLAVLREYSANAWDAHRDVGKFDLPIEVTLPTATEPTLTIRDHGPGLSHEDIFLVYTKYGASTKRGSNSTVGHLGIGSKSSFCYTDSFTVTSWNGGFKRVYSALLDVTDTGQMKLLHEEPIFMFFDGEACLGDMTGIEVKIAVNPLDVQEFHKKARGLFQHFNPRPIINMDLPAPPSEQTVLTHGTIYPVGEETINAGVWHAVMGCVNYRVNISQLPPNEISPSLNHINGYLSFDIGDVQVAVSREELKYTTATKQALINKFNDLIDEYVLQALKALENNKLTDWEKRLSLRVLHQLQLPLPEEWAEWTTEWVKFTYDENVMSVVRNGNHTTRITVSKSTRLLIDDTDKDLNGYGLQHEDYIVRSKGMAIDTLVGELNTSLIKSQLLGIQVVRLSALTWTAPFKPAKRKYTYSPKHRATMFKLNSVANFCSPWSQNWEVCGRTPDPADIFMLIKGFKAHDYDHFFYDYREDRDLLKSFGLSMPVVYGYKTSDKRPREAKDCVGVEYRVWREQMIKDLLTPSNLKLIDAWFWENGKNEYDNKWSAPEAKRRNKLAAEIGTDHPIIVLFDSMVKGEKDLKGNKASLPSLIKRAKIEFKDSIAYRAMAGIETSYPLLKAASLSMLWDVDAIVNSHPDRYSNANKKDIRQEAQAQCDAWVEYIQIIDTNKQLIADAVLRAKGKKGKTNGNQIAAVLTD